MTIIFLAYINLSYAQRRTVQEQHWLPLIQYESGKEPATPKKKLGIIWFDPNGDFVAKDYDGNKTYFAGQNISIDNFYEWAIDGNIIYVDGSNRSVGFFTNTPSASAYIQLSDKLVICKTFTSAGINACIDALGTEGGEIYLPEGIYTCTTQITIDTNNTTLSGSGPGTILRSSGTNFTVISANNYGNITIRDLTIDGQNQTRTQSLVYLTASGTDDDGWINIEGCDFINMAGAGMAGLTLLGDGNQQVFNVTDCHFRNFANGTYALETDNTQTNVKGCSFIEVDVGLYFYYPRASTVTASTFSRNTDYSVTSVMGSVNIIGNGFYKNSYRDVRMGSEGNVTGNTFRGNTGDYALYIWSNRQSTITANQFYDNDVIGDICINTSQRCTITANQFYADGTNDPNHHLYFSNGDDCVVASNVFDTDVDVSAIYMDSSDTGNVVYGNKNTSFSGSNRTYDDFTLYASLVYAGIDSDTITIDPNASPVSYTLTPTATYVELTCNDPNNCNLSMSETGAVQGQIVEIVNVSANSIVLHDSSGVCESENPTLGQWDTVRLIYASDRWVQHGPVGNN